MGRLRVWDLGDLGFIRFFGLGLGTCGSTFGAQDFECSMHAPGCRARKTSSCWLLAGLHGDVVWAWQGERQDFEKLLLTFSAACVRLGSTTS